MSLPIRLRRGTEAEWTASDPTLALGELGLTSDTHRIKVGDGVLAWTALPWVDDYGQTTVSGVVAVDADYEITDERIVLVVAPSTILLPTAAYKIGRMVDIKSVGVPAVVATSETIDGLAGIHLSPWESLTLVSTNTEWVVL